MDRALRLRSGQASDFELDGVADHPVYGGNFRPSSRWSEPEFVHTEHKIHPFHPNCTSVAPGNINQITWYGGLIK